MAYDDTLPNDRNWVRFLIQDTAASPLLSDAEIDAVVAQARVTGSAVKYAAAAQCLHVLLTQYLKKGAGLSKKKVKNLELWYGSMRGRSEILDQIAHLNNEAVARSAVKPKAIKAVTHPAVSGV